MSIGDPRAGQAGSELVRLRGLIKELESVAVAFSGGVDSSVVLKVAYDCLGERAVGVTAISESLPAGELEQAQALAREIGVRHVMVQSRELSNPDYLANTMARCFHCKDEVYSQIHEWAGRNGYAKVLDGFNADDLADHRPGHDAGLKLGVRSPLLEAGLNKQAVRALARSLGLPVADKPALACLSSRIPYGTPVTIEALRQVDRAETQLRSLGLTQVRVRHFGPVARIEVLPAEIPLLLSLREPVLARLRDLGFRTITIDLEGYRSGSLNGIPTTGPHSDGR
ncbi:MAG: ATP-dependent sacrificial sulfur transferase LarE [Acidobacteria bacterium]|nr:ATP-dependent sacrificial sulfur transferase LarE [Acidobacteriota bacterium]